MMPTLGIGLIEGAIPSEAVENRVYHNLIHPAGAAAVWSGKSVTNSADLRKKLILAEDLLRYGVFSLENCNFCY